MLKFEFGEKNLGDLEKEVIYNDLYVTKIKIQAWI